MTISLGNAYTNASGQTVLNSAGGSGLDEQTLITAGTADLTAQITPIQDQVTLNNSKTAALQQFSTLLTTLQNAASALSNPPGFNQASNNAFAYVNATVTSNDGSTAANYITVSAQPGTAAQNFTLGTPAVGMTPAQAAIIQLAQSTQQVSNTFTITNANSPVVQTTPAADSGLFQAGTFTVKGINGNPAASITLNNNDSLNTVAADFNAVTSQTGISASVVQISSGTYDLEFTGQSGLANDFSLNPADSNTVVTDTTGVLTTGGVTFTTQQTAQNSEFVLDGQTIVRATNSISDAVSGVTFNLLQATKSTTQLTTAIAPNTTQAENGIVNFMNAYNAVMQFYAQQTQLNSSGTYASTSYLATDNVLTSTVNQIESELSNSVAGLPNTTLNSLSSVGITFTNLPAQTDSAGKQTQPAVNNVLTYNQTTLESALSSNFSQVQQIFGFTFNSSNANLAVNTRTNNLSATSFTLNIDPVDNIFQATPAGGSPINLTVTTFSSGNGYTLTGPAGSALDGLMMLYASSSAATINVTATQGIGDWINNLTTALTKASTGAIAADQSNLTTSTTSLQNNITLINQQITATTTQLQAKYTALEQAIAQANTLQETLTAQTDAALAATAS